MELAGSMAYSLVGSTALWGCLCSRSMLALGTPCEERRVSSVACTAVESCTAAGDRLAVGPEEVLLLVVGRRMGLN